MPPYASCALKGSGRPPPFPSWWLEGGHGVVILWEEQYWGWRSSKTEGIWGPGRDEGKSSLLSQLVSLATQTLLPRTWTVLAPLRLAAPVPGGDRPPPRPHPHPRQVSACASPAGFEQPRDLGEFSYVHCFFLVKLLGTHRLTFNTSLQGIKMYTSDFY